MIARSKQDIDLTHRLLREAQNDIRRLGDARDNHAGEEHQEKDGNEANDHVTWTSFEVGQRITHTQQEGITNTTRFTPRTKFTLSVIVTKLTTSSTINIITTIVLAAVWYCQYWLLQCSWHDRLALQYI